MYAGRLMLGVGGMNPQHRSVQRGTLDHHHGLVAPAIQGVEPHPLSLHEHPKPVRAVEVFLLLEGFSIHNHSGKVSSCQKLIQKCTFTWPLLT